MKDSKQKRLNEIKDKTDNVLLCKSIKEKLKTKEVKK